MDTGPYHDSDVAIEVPTWLVTVNAGASAAHGVAGGYCLRDGAVRASPVAQNYGSTSHNHYTEPYSNGSYGSWSGEVVSCGNWHTQAQAVTLSGSSPAGCQRGKHLIGLALIVTHVHGDRTDKSPSPT